MPFDVQEAAARAPGGIYLAGEDNLRLTTFNSAAGVRLTVSGRIADIDRGPSPFEFGHTPNTDRTSAATLFNPGTGWLLHGRIVATAGTPVRGQCFAILEVVRGFTGAVIPLAVLFQGYVGTIERGHFPGGRIESPLEGPGVMRAFGGTNPAPGAAGSETVPTGARWRLHGWHQILVTSAVAANREMRLTVTSQGGVAPYSVSSRLVQVASLTRAYNWHSDAERFALAQDTRWDTPLPRIWLPAQSVIATTVVNMDGGDNLDQPLVMIEEWIEG